MTFLFYATLSALIFVAIILILLILIQKGRGGGLSSAFGGSGGTTAFGAKTGDVLTWATAIIFGVFIVLAVALDLVVQSKYPSTAPPTASGRSSTVGTTALPPGAVPPGPTRTTPVTTELPPPATMPTVSTMPVTTPVTVPTAPATTRSVGDAMSDMNKAMQPATSAPAKIENGLKKIGDDLSKVGQGLKPATKP